MNGLAAVKRANKMMLDRLVRERLGLHIDPRALFECADQSHS